jgi:hypothetical protein
VKSSLTKKKRPSSHGLRESLEENEFKLPKLLKGWEWQVRNGFYAACLFTWEYDCIVEIRDAALHLSTGVAPIEIVKSVLKANNLNHKYQTRTYPLGHFQVQPNSLLSTWWSGHPRTVA